MASERQTNYKLRKLARVAVWATCLGCSLSASTAWAVDVAAAADSLAREADRIQREEQLRQQQQFENDRRGSRPPTRIEAPKVPLPQGAQGGACRQIDTIYLTGAVHLSAADREDLIKPYSARCLAVTDIESLLGDIARLYIDRGYIASRAYLPAQDLSTRALTVLVVEGQVSGFQVEGPPAEGASQPATPAPHLYLGNIFPGVVGKPLNLRDIEQGLDQINRLASNNAAMEVRPGDAPGDSIVAITNAPTRPWHVYLNADNQGTSSTGRDQIAATLGLDDLLGLNDYLSVTRRQSVPHEGDKNSSSETYSYVVPYGYSTFSLGGSHSHYASALHIADGLELLSTGTSRTAFLRADHVAWRDQVTRLSCSAMLTAKDTQNYLADQLLSVSSRKLTVLDVAAELARNVGGGAFKADLGYSRGLPSLGAQRDMDGLPDDAPHAQFGKLTFGLSYVRGFAVGGMEAGISSQFSGQYADQALHGSEQISVGGIYTVRGFYVSSLAGDRGYYWRNDVSLKTPVGNWAGRPLTLKPYVALDAGRVSSVSPDNPVGSLVGAAIGMSLAAGPVFIDIFAGHPVHRDSSLRVREGTTSFIGMAYTL